MGKNNNRWGQIKEVEINEISPVNPSQYYELYEELSLRLEQTPPKLALRIDFDDADDAKNTRRAVQRHFDVRKGEDAAICCIRRLKDGRGALYVYRGKNWK